MEHRVIGYLYHPPQTAADQDQHTHEVYLISIDGKPLHVHEFSGVTSVAVGHQHSFAGVTEPAPSGVPHTHKFMAVTSIAVGHTHKLKGVTGPAIPLPNGGHIHRFEGVTTVDGATPHRHSFQGKTGGAMAPETPPEE